MEVNVVDHEEYEAVPFRRQFRRREGQVRDIELENAVAGQTGQPWRIPVADELFAEFGPQVERAGLFAPHARGRFPQVAFQGDHREHEAEVEAGNGVGEDGMAPRAIDRIQPLREVERGRLLGRPEQERKREDTDPGQQAPRLEQRFGQGAAVHVVQERGENVRVADPRECNQQKCDKLQHKDMLQPGPRRVSWGTASHARRPHFLCRGGGGSPFTQLELAACRSEALTLRPLQLSTTSP